MKNKFILLLILFPLLGFAQNVKKDFEAINKAMLAENYSVSLEYKTYLDNVLTETLKSSVNVKGKKYRVEAANMIKISDGKKNLIVDHNNKMMIFSIPDNMIQFTKTKPQLDSFMSKAESITFKKMENSIGRYVIILKNAVEKRIELDFNINTFVINRIYMVYNQKEEDGEGKEQERSLEVNYLAFTKVLKVNVTQFDLSFFILKRGKSYYATAKYAKYELINLLPKD